MTPHRRFAAARPPLGLLAGAALAGALFASPAWGEVVVAATTIPAGTTIEAGHLAFAAGQPAPGLLSRMEPAIGLENRVAIYAGRPVRAADLGPPTVVRRNAVIALEFRRGAMVIQTDGRALDEGGLGDRIRVMNLDSRRTIVATISGPNRAEAR